LTRSHSRGRPHARCERGASQRPDQGCERKMVSQTNDRYFFVGAGLARKTLAAAVGSMLVGALPAGAQEGLVSGGAASPPGSVLEEVVVTARNRAERAQNVPVPISVVSGNQIDRDRAFTVADLTLRAPGLTATTPNARRTGVSIRGIGKASGNDNMEA